MRHLEEELEELRKRLLEMSSLVESAISTVCSPSLKKTSSKRKWS